MLERSKGEISVMKVSVIIPLYNAEKYIIECINSVINQTYKELEIIVVDDGSTDDSLNIVRSMYGGDERVIIVSQKNRGGCVARNVGIHRATGEYIQFLDADDKLDLNKIQVQMDLLKKMQYPKDVLVFSAWTKLGVPLSEMGSNQTSVWHDYETPIDILVDFSLYQCCLPPSVYLTSIELIRRAGGWNEQLKRNQDGEFFARIIKKSNSLRFANNALTYYRSTPNSVSKAMNYLSAESWIDSLILTSDIIIQGGHPKTKEAVYKMISSCLYRMYPYYRKQRKKGETYLQNVCPDYHLVYPKLNWKEYLFWGIQLLRKAPNL